MEKVAPEKYPALLKLRRKFRKEIFEADSQDTWVILHNKQNWTLEYADLLLPVFLSQLDSFPTRSSSRAKEDFTIKIPGTQVEDPSIEVKIQEQEILQLPLTDIPIPIQPLRTFTESLIRWGAEPTDVLIEILYSIRTELPQELREELELRAAGQTDNSTVEDIAEYQEVSLFSPESEKKFRELLGEKQENVEEATSDTPTPTSLEDTDRPLVSPSLSLRN